MLQNVKTGDWIFTIMNGWIKAKITASVGCWPVLTAYKHSYLRDGRFHSEALYPSAWTYNPFDANDKPPCEFREGEVVMKQCFFYPTTATDCPGMFGERPMIFRDGVVTGHLRKLNQTERGEGE